MATVNDTFSMFAGTSRELVVTVTHDGVPYDLTNHTGEWCLSARQGAVALLSKVSGAGVELTHADLGECTVTLAHADTKGMAGLYYWELRMVDASSNEDVVAYGRVRILPSTTDVSPVV